MNKEQLTEVLKKHTLWLDDKEGGEKADLSREDLSHMDLSQEKLSWANLSWADLTAVDLRNTDLRHANLTHANLRYADLRYAQLRFADLRFADLRHANLRHADLSSAKIDFSAFPLWAGGLSVHIDDKIGVLLLYHAIQNIMNSPYTSEPLKKIGELASVKKQLAKFPIIGGAEEKEEETK